MLKNDTKTMKILILLLLVAGLAFAADCTGPCGCDAPAGYTELNISVYDEFGPITPQDENRRMWIEYEKGELVRDIIWDGWNKSNNTDEIYRYKIPSCVEDPVSLDYYIYLYNGNSSCQEEYSRQMDGRGALLANGLEWNGSVYSDDCITGYQFKLIRSYFETSVPLYLYPDRYSKYSKSGGGCAPALVLLGVLALAFRSS